MNRFSWRTSQDEVSRLASEAGFCGLERLEGRTLLSADFVGGVLTIHGTEGDDQIHLLAGPEVGQVVVAGVEGVEDGTMFEGVEAILVMGLGGDDLIEAEGAFQKDKKGHGKRAERGGHGVKDMKVVLDGGAGDDILKGSAGRDLLIGGAGVDTLDLSEGTSGADVNLKSGKVRRDGYGSRDRVEGIENIIGTAFDDRLRGDGEANVIEGGAGDDKIDGRKGDDALYGGEGDDKIKGGKGDDLLVGNDGVDLLKDRRGFNVMYEGDGPVIEPRVDVGVDLLEGYLREVESNDDEGTANAYDLTVDEALKVGGEVAEGDRDYIKITAIEAGALSVDVKTVSGDPVVVRVLVAGGFELFRFSSDGASTVQDLPIFAGTEFYIVIEAPVGGGSVEGEGLTYLVDILQASA